jgi:hypothetical protein
MGISGVYLVQKGTSSMPFIAVATLQNASLKR